MLLKCAPCNRIASPAWQTAHAKSWRATARKHTRPVCSVNISDISAELFSGRLLSACQETFPKVPWGAKELGKVIFLTASTAVVCQAAVTYTGGTALTPPVESLPAAEPSSESAVSSFQGSDSTAAALGLAGTHSNAPLLIPNDGDYSEATTEQPQLQPSAAPAPLLPQNSLATQQESTDALRHAATEAALLLGTGAILWSALGSSRPREAGMFSYALTTDWLVVVLAFCCVAFPVADPVVAQAWAGALGKLGFSADDAYGGTRAYMQQLTSCRDAQDSLSLGLHGVASTALGPVWEETFWRGFFLASLTHVLPLPACVAVSSVGFAALHLTPANILPFLLLAPLGDYLFLRSASLGPPILLHSAWNAYQIIAVLLGKHYFV